jgi:hypothetical protein
MAILIAACGSAGPMPDDAVVECAEAARSEGSIGGSEQLVSALVLRLPDEAVSPEETPEREAEAAFDRAFSEMYGIDVDEFLSLRDDADTATMARLGEPPGVGEQVSDEWFVQRDLTLLQLWNQRHPASARALCELVEEWTN